MTEFWTPPQEISEKVRDSHPEDLGVYKEEIIPVSVDNGIARIEPGEAGLVYWLVQNCAVLAQKDTSLYMMHLRQGTSFAHALHAEFGDDLSFVFDEALLIARYPDPWIPYFYAYFKQMPQVLKLADNDVSYLSILGYNNPDYPGNIASFDMWIDTNEY